MTERYFEDDNLFMLGSVRTYQKATRLMCETWKRTVGEPLVLGAKQPLAQFEEALGRYDEKLKQQTSESKELQQMLLLGAQADPAVDDLLDDTLNRTAETIRTALDRDMDCRRGFVPLRFWRPQKRGRSEEKWLPCRSVSSYAPS